MHENDTALTVTEKFEQYSGNASESSPSSTLASGVTKLLCDETLAEPAGTGLALLGSVVSSQCGPEVRIAHPARSLAAIEAERI
jgi:hypothetical protein